MCRSIKVLRKTGQPLATKDEVSAAARQFIRKVTGSRNPARVHEAAYEEAIADITAITGRLLAQMEIKAKASA
ncbi:MAG: DUF2277 domain-containing protein [Bryobacterales bacterium]|nr:DUF2277 domain-containing protein [Bryobacterales bacterium]